MAFLKSERARARQWRRGGADNQRATNVVFTVKKCAGILFSIVQAARRKPGEIKRILDFSIKILFGSNSGRAVSRDGFFSHFAGKAYSPARFEGKGGANATRAKAIAPGAIASNNDDIMKV